MFVAGFFLSVVKLLVSAEYAVPSPQAFMHMPSAPSFADLEPTQVTVHGPIVPSPTVCAVTEEAGILCVKASSMQDVTSLNQSQQFRVLSGGASHRSGADSSQIVEFALNLVERRAANWPTFLLFIGVVIIVVVIVVIVTVIVDVIAFVVIGCDGVIVVLVVIIGIVIVAIASLL